MRNAHLIIAAALAGALLAGCDDHHHHDNNSGGVPSDFGAYAMSLITGKSCDTAGPEEINALAFSFDENQSLDANALTPGCTPG